MTTIPSISQRVVRCTAPVIAVVLLLVQFGCAGARPVATSDAPPLQPDDQFLVVSNNSIVADAEDVTRAASIKARQKTSEAAAAGAAGGALGAASAFGPYVLYPPLTLVALGAAVISGVGAGIYEAVNAPSAEEVDCATKKFVRVLDDMHVNEMLSFELQKRLQEDTGVTLPIIPAGTEFVNALSPKLVFAELDFTRYDIKKGVPIVLKSTLLRMRRDGSIKSFGNIDLHLGPRTPKQWCGLDDEMWREELADAVVELARRMEEHLLVARELDHPSTSKCPSYRGLAAVSPPAIDEERYPPEVGSLQPTLHWEPFPRQADLAVDPQLSAHMTKVVYDLMIWKPEFDPEHNNNFHFIIDRKLIYSIKGLTETSHKIETNLKLNTIYAWAVRPRFYINGTCRALPWSKLTYSSDECLFKIYEDRDYVFTTP